MKFTITLICTLLFFITSSVVIADAVKTFKVGDAEVSYRYKATDTGIKVLSLTALISETNNALRGLKNTDQRRLGELGQLVYQCRLMLYKPSKNADIVNSNNPILVSKNYSLFTGVDINLPADERLGIRVQALKEFNDSSLFTKTLGNRNPQKEFWETVNEGSAINLTQFSISTLKEPGIVETSESIDILVRFPIFQLQKPVHQWSYNFYLRDFKQAVRHADKNCTAAKLLEQTSQGS